MYTSIQNGYSIIIGRIVEYIKSPFENGHSLGNDFDFARGSYEVNIITCYILKTPLVDFEGNFP